MPVGPSYRDGSRPSSATSDGSVAAPVTGACRVCGTSASKEPNVTSSSTPKSAASSSTSFVNVRQRRLGSIPSRMIASRSVPGIGAWKKPLSGQSSLRVSPSTSETCGLVVWKSKKPSGSISPKRAASHCLAR